MSEQGSSPRRPGALTRFNRSVGVNALWLAIAAAIVVAVAVVAFLIALSETAMEPATVGTELTKALVQLAVVAVGGAVIAAILKVAELDREARGQKAEIRSETRRRRAEARRDRQRDEFEYLMSIFGDVSAAYNTTKSVQRKLDGAGLQLDPPRLNEDQSRLLEAQMDTLNQAQLSLESTMRVVRVRHSAFDKSEDTPVYLRLTYCLRQMEGYVNDVLKDTRRHPSTLVRLAEFLGPVNGTGGLRAGGRMHSAKDNEAGWEASEKEPGNGPSAHMRHIEHIIAETIPGGSPIPFELSSAEDDREADDAAIEAGQ